MSTSLHEQARQGQCRIPWYLQDETDKSLAARGMKLMKCATCLDVFQAERDALYVQCVPCLMEDRPVALRKLHLNKATEAAVEQMELGEVAS